MSLAPTDPANDAVARRLSKEIDKTIEQERIKFNKQKVEPRLLILGTSDSGKSTLLKQVKLLHGSGFSDQICQVVLESLPEVTPKYAEFGEQLENDTRYFFGLAPLAEELWIEGSEFRAAYSRLPSNSLPESSSFFMGNIARIKDKDYIPSNEDILRLRTVTQQISETVFNIGGKNYHFIDVSGLRHHRKAWVPYLCDNLNCILFIIDLCGYNLTMIEDDKTNRMKDALLLFQDVVNNPLLLKHSIILFFNKKDLYDKMIKEHPISSTEFPDYTGAEKSPSRGIAYFQERFKSTVKGKRNILVHTTCATDTTAIGVIIDEIIHNIVSSSLQEFGIA